MKKKASESRKLQLNRETLNTLEKDEKLFEAAQGAKACNTRLTCSTNLC
jgi:hypothetical protein